MKCPQCTETDLLMTNRTGVEIDYCPKCRGVWLDRGELDKIIERDSRGDQRGSRGRDFDDDDDDDDRRRRGGYDSPGYGREYDPRSNDRYAKRKSFWTELFD